MKKFVAWLLVGLMVFSALPLSAFAVEGEHDHDHEALAEANCPGKDVIHTKQNCADNYDLVEVHEANCGSRGYTSYQCRTCGEMFADDFVKAPGKHNWVDYAGKAATCKENGYEAGKECTICGEIDAKLILATGNHTWGEPELVEGDKIYTCTTCGETKSETVDCPNGHEWTIPPEIIKEPNCGTEGEAKYTCEECGVTKIVPIRKPADPHVLTYHAYKAPTCLEAGNIEYWSCEVCGQNFTKGSSLALWNAKKDVVTHQSFDELRINGDGANGVFPGGQAASWTSKVATLDETAEYLHYWGWIGGKGEMGQFGYRINNDGEIIYNASFAFDTEQGVVDDAATTGADHASRMLIKIDLTGLTGENTVDVYYKNAAGSVALLNEFTVILPGETSTTLTPGDAYTGDVVLKALGHDMVTIDDKLATCTEAGEKHEECSRCDYKTDKVPVAALNHNEWKDAKVIEEVKPTCVSKGYQILECPVGCGETKKVELDIDTTLAGHRPSGPVQVVEVTCTTWGGEWQFCPLCGEHIQLSKTEPLGHTTWAEANDAENPKGTVLTDVAPTCEKDGEQTWECGRCGEAQKNVLKAVGHKEVTGTVAANCMNPGYTFTYCTNDCCDWALVTEAECYHDEAAITIKHSVAVITEANPTGAVHYKADSLVHGTEIDPTNHDIKIESYIKETCTTPGAKVTYCTRCNEHNEEVIPATGHKAGKKTDTVKQSCLTGGKWEIRCEYCEIVLESGDYEQYGSHLEYELKETHPVSCVPGDDGYELWACPRCGEEEKRKVTPFNPVDPLYYADINEAAKVHKNVSLTPDDTKYREATCQRVALKAHYCSDCKNYVLVIDEEYPQLAHAWDPNGKAPARVEPTCTKDGYIEGFVCYMCEQIQPKTVLEALGHKAIDATTAKAPTCTEPGTTAGSKCERCGEILEEPKVLEAIGHKMTHFEATAPTCLDKGWNEHYKCSNCSKYFADEEGKTEMTEAEVFIAALGHAWEIADFSETVNCTTFQYDHWVCGRCGDTKIEYIDNYIKAWGHKWVLDTTLEGYVAVTCDKDGVNTYRCENEGCEETKTEAVAHKGHFNGTEYFFEICTDKVTDRDCDVCGRKDIGKPHVDGLQYFKQEPTCLEQGYEMEFCPICKFEYAWNYVEPTGKHTWGAWVNEDAPTFEKAGTMVRFCTVCDAKDSETLAVDPLIKFSATIVNAANANGGIADSSLIAVTVSLENILGVDTQTMKFDVYFNEALLDFEGYKFVDGTAFNANQKANQSASGVISVAAATSNAIVDGAPALTNHNVKDKEALVTLYFRVTSAEPATITISFSESGVDDNMALNADKELVAFGGVDATAAVVRFMDINDDGDRNLVDAQIAIEYAMEDKYDVRLDIDKDGKVTAIDVMYYYDFLVSTLTYADCVAMRAEAEAE